MQAVSVTFSPDVSLGAPVKLFDWRRTPAVISGRPYDVSPVDGSFVFIKPAAPGSDVGSNWSTGTAPEAGDDVIIDRPGAPAEPAAQAVRVNPPHRMATPSSVGNTLELVNPLGLAAGGSVWRTLTSWVDQARSRVRIEVSEDGVAWEAIHIIEPGDTWAPMVIELLEALRSRSLEIRFVIMRPSM